MLPHCPGAPSDAPFSVLHFVIKYSHVAIWAFQKNYTYSHVVIWAWTININIASEARWPNISTETPRCVCFWKEVRCVVPTLGSAIWQLLQFEQFVVSLACMSVDWNVWRMPWQTVRLFEPTLTSLKQLIFKVMQVILMGLDLNPSHNLPMQASFWLTRSYLIAMHRTHMIKLSDQPTLIQLQPREKGGGNWYSAFK